MAFFQSSPRRKVPTPLAPPQHGALNPMSVESGDLRDFRWQVTSTTVFILALGLFGYAVYGPWFSVRNVTISGTREINPASIKLVADHQLKQWRFGLLPNRNLWLLSRRSFSALIKKKIQERVSIEDVRLIKKNRHDLQIEIIERSPVAIWKAGDQQATIDRTGVIITTAAQTGPLPLMVDAGNKPFSIDQQVLTEPVMVSFKTVNDAFADIALPVEHYLIPVPTCPTEIIQPTKTNQPDATNENANENINSPANTNTAVLNENINGVAPEEVGPQAVQTDCDLGALAKASQEIHVKLKDGPLVLFDRHQDLRLAVQTVKRLLGDKTNSGATYIDIRFQERVYIK